MVFTKLNDNALSKVVGGVLDDGEMTYLDFVIMLSKKLDKTLEECIYDLYTNNATFNQEKEEYVRSHWY